MRYRAVPGRSSPLSGRSRFGVLLAALCGLFAQEARSQAIPLQRGSENIEVVGHLPMGARLSLQDPSNPVTVGYYDTYLGPLNQDFNPVFNDTFGVDVRNEDGLIVVSDSSRGLWVFRMEGFSGWDGEQWGYPDISSVQDWDRGPVRQRLIGQDP